MTRRALYLLTAVCGFATPLQAGSPQSVTYTYDDLGRLRTGDLGAGVKIDYQYDAAGNRKAMSSGNTPTISIGNAANVTEGTSLSFPVTRTGTTTGTVTVKCAPQNGTAMAGNGGVAPFDDFVTTQQTVTFLSTDPSPTTKNCTIATKTDTYYEGSQTVAVVLLDSTAGTVIQPPGSATGTILDATTAPSFSVGGSSNNEGGATSFTVTKSGLTELSHSISYATANGTATTADNDYTAIATTPVVFAPSQTSLVVPVSTTSDSKFENSETLTLNLSAATNGATIGTSSATGTIVNDDPAPSIVIGDSVATNEGNLVTLTVQNVGNTNTAFTHSISWATANGTAIAGSDYVAASGTVSFSSGETSKNVQVQSLADGVYEGATETFLVNLTTNANTNGALITDSQGVGAIADIDSPTPSTPTMNTPLFVQNTTGSYSVSWQASNGPIHHYVLEEELNGGGAFTSFTPYTVNSPSVSKAFSGKSAGEYRYRVKGCSVSDSCSAYSAVKFIQVCPGGCSFAPPPGGR